MLKNISILIIIMSSQAEQQQTKSTDSTQSTTLTQLKALTGLVDSQVQTFKEMSRALKKLEKEVVKEQKRLSKVPKTKRTVKQNPVEVTKPMSKFLTSRKVESQDGGWTRQVMMKGIASYIKDKDLQLADDKKKWKPDKTLTDLFSLDTEQLYTFMNINGLISRVVVKKK